MPPEDAGGVVDELGAMAEVDRELLRVAAADVQPVDVEQRVEHLDRRQDAFAPPAVPDATARAIPELVLEGATPLERHECKFEVWSRHTVVHAWAGFPLAAELDGRLGKPTRLANDADMHGLAVIRTARSCRGPDTVGSLVRRRRGS